MMNHIAAQRATRDGRVQYVVDHSVEFDPARGKPGYEWVAPFVVLVSPHSPGYVMLDHAAKN
jgi:hypothetical protein